MTMITPEQRKKYRKTARNKAKFLKTEKGKQFLEKQNIIKALKTKYNGFNIEFDPNVEVYSIDVVLPFRCQITKYGLTNMDTNAYIEIQKDLRKRITSILNTRKHITVVEENYVQSVITDIEKIEDVIVEIKKWGRENVEKYGEYVFKGKKIANYL